MYLTQEQIKVILSKANYWNEVIKRTPTEYCDPIQIFRDELAGVIREISPPVILFILEDYANRNKEPK